MCRRGGRVGLGAAVAVGMVLGIALATTLGIAPRTPSSSVDARPAQGTPTEPAEQTAARLVGLAGGTTHAVDSDGRYVVASVGLQLAVYDARSASPLAVVGRLAPLPAPPYKIAIRDSMAYVSFSNRSVMRVSLQDPTRPTMVDETPMPGLTGFDVGDGVLFAAINYELRAFDTGSATPLRQLSVVDVDNLGVEQVAVDGDRVYAAGMENPSTDRLDAIHILTQRQGEWKVVGQIPTLLRVDAIDAASGRVVVVGSGNIPNPALRSWKVDEPNFPPFGGTLRLDRFPVSARIEGTTVRVGMANLTLEERLEAGEFAVVDVTDALAPRLTARLDTPDATYDAVTVGNLAYLAQYRNGLRLLDVSDPEVPLDGPQVPTLGAAQAIAVADGFAYVVQTYLERMRRLVAVDISHPEAPVVASSEAIPNGEGTGRVSVAGDRVYVFTTAFRERQKIARYDRRQPGRLRPIDSIVLPEPESILDVLMDGDRAYAWEPFMIQVMNLATSPPAVLARIPITEPVSALSSSNNRLFVSSVCCANAGELVDTLTVYDVADGTHPVTLGQVHLATHGSARKPSALALATDQLGVVATGNLEVVTVDLSDSRRPRVLGRLAVSHVYRFVAVAGRHAMLYDPTGLRPIFVDLADPAAPRLVGELDRDLVVMEAAGYDGRFVLAAMNAGLVILEPAGREPATPTSTVPAPTTAVPPSPTATPVVLESPTPHAPPTASRTPEASGRAYLPALWREPTTITPVPPQP